MNPCLTRGLRFELELELDLIPPYMTEKPVLRGEVGARVRVIRVCGQRREGRYGWARFLVKWVNILQAAGSLRTLGGL